jgi:hypothetical protein
MPIMFIYKLVAGLFNVVILDVYSVCTGFKTASVV